MPRDKAPKAKDQASARVGVYVCHCGINIAKTVDVTAVADYASQLPGVAIARHYLYMCSQPGQDLIQKDIKELGLTRVVVAACSPRMHEPTFRGAVFGAGMNPYLFEMANIREQCSWVHDDRTLATAKAKDLVRSAVARARLLDELFDKEVEVTRAILVIGGGVAGIQAALDSACAGFKTYLVESSPSLGGHMAQLDKTFPTLDCSACILTPKMVEAARHPNIELLSYSEVAGVSGSAGNFTVQVRRKPRYVDETKCTNCGLCADACVMRGKPASEFDMGLSRRSAIYIPFAQAIPACYCIDPKSCIMLRTGKCGKEPACARACPANAIDFTQKELVSELKVGAIIVATGYEQFDARLKPEFGYGKYKNVLTGLELERITSAGGPTKGEITIDGKVPQDVVLIHCVGSRDQQIGNAYCSRVCCMYLAKQAHLVKERLPDARVTVYYMDVRAFGKGFEEFYDRVKQEGVFYRRGNPSEIYRQGDRLVVRVEDTLLGEIIEHQTDLVVLGTGLIPSPSTIELAKILRLSLSADRFLLEAHPKLRPVDSTIDGVFLAGCCQGPKDIPDTVAQAKGAASAAIGLLASGKVKVEPAIAVVDAELCTGCHVCQSVCSYQAPEFDREKKVSVINEVLCKGCGVCPAACPAGAITMRHFKDEQIQAQVDALCQGSLVDLETTSQP
ncbi:MAG: CoB--CoM heterodisulfide reductase iron-sulfur subunit A family protein [candidate division WOR-3 bacterium]